MSIPEKELEEVAALMRKQFEESQSPEAKAEIEKRIHEREEEIYRKVTELAKKTIRSSSILTDISGMSDIGYEMMVEIVAA